MKKKAVYLLSENNEFELPVLVSDNVREIADFLGITIDSAYCNITRHKPSIGKDRKYKLEKIFID